MAELPAVPPGSCRGTGYVYFILAEQNLIKPMVKIGFSLRRPDTRMKDCQTGSPAPSMRLVLIIVGRMADERALHERFADYRSHNEWFFWEGDLRLFVEEFDA